MNATKASEQRGCHLNDIDFHIAGSAHGLSKVPRQRLIEWREAFNALFYGPRPSWAPALSATSPAAEIAMNRADANLKIGQTGVTQDGVPYVVVPKEPTEEMCEPLHSAIRAFIEGDSDTLELDAIYRAMTSPSALSANGGK